MGGSGGSKPPALVPPAAAPAAVISPSAPPSGSPSAPAGLTATVEADDIGNESLADSFWWYGDDDVAEYNAKSSVSGSLPCPTPHPPPTPLEPLCCRVAMVTSGPLASYAGLAPSCPPSDPASSSDNIVLPPGLVLALLKAISPEDVGASLCLVVADTGATNHMIPDCLAFISYKSVQHLRVWMGNNSYAPVLGRGMAIISLNGQHLLICNVLHVPTLSVPLYSLCMHLCQCSGGFVGSHDMGMHVYFLGVVLSVDTSTDYHLTYEPLGKSAPLSTLHYVQPCCLPTIYPAKPSAFHAHTGDEVLPSMDPVLIKDDGSATPIEASGDNGFSVPVYDAIGDIPLLYSHVPKRGPRAGVKSLSPDAIATISRHLQHLLTELLGLSGSPPTDSTPLDPGPVAPRLLLSLSHDDVVCLVHCPGSTPPPVRPCDCSNGSNTKTHWTLEDVHWALGCCRFWNYKHIIQTSLDGQWVDGGEFPMSLGSYATIPKVARGRPITREQSFFLDHVNVDIAFGDCDLVGWFWYALIFVDRATRYNWVFGLKDLLADSILTAFHLFRANAGSHAQCF